MHLFFILGSTVLTELISAQLCQVAAGCPLVFGLGHIVISSEVLLIALLLLLLMMLLLFVRFNKQVRKTISTTQNEKKDLGKSEREYRLLFEENPMPMLIYDRENLSILNVNQAAVLHYGYSMEEFLSMTIKDIRPPEDVEKVMEIVRSEEGILRKPGVWTHWKKNQIPIQVEITSAETTYNGRSARLVLINDVTDWVAQDEQLLLKNNLLNAIIQASPLAIFDLDQQGNVSSIWNPAAESIFGWTAAEVVGRPLPIVKPENQAEFDQLKNRVLRGESFTGIEVKRVRKDGSEIDLSLSTAPFSMRDGEITHVMAIVSDISQQKEMQRDLALTSQQFDMLAQYAVEINLAKREDEITHLCVEQSRRILGVQKAILSFTLDQSNHQEIAAFSIHEAYNQWYDLLAHHQQKQQNGIFQVICQKNQVMKFSSKEISSHPAFKTYGLAANRNAPLNGWIGIPLVDSNRANMGVLQISDKHRGEFTGNDLFIATQIAYLTALAVEKNRLVVQLSQANEQTKKLARQVLDTQEKERMVISRELHDEAGQTLTALKLNIQMLADDLGTVAPEIDQQLREIVAITDMTLTQIRNLSHLLRPPNLERQGLKESLEGLCKDISRLSNLEVDSEIELPFMVPVQVGTAIYRVLQESLTNVVKHAQAQHCHVSLKQRNNRIELVVEDDGIGFDGEEKPDRSGIGLRGIRDRLALLEGELKLESGASKGLKLTAIIPWSAGDD